MYPCDFSLCDVFRDKTNTAIHGIIGPLKTNIRKPLKSNVSDGARVACAASSGRFYRMKVVYWGYVYRVKYYFRYPHMDAYTNKINPISFKLAVILHEKERHWKVTIYLPSPVYQRLCGIFCFDLHQFSIVTQVFRASQAGRTPADTRYYLEHPLTEHPLTEHPLITSTSSSTSDCTETSPSYSVWPETVTAVISQSIIDM